MKTVVITGATSFIGVHLCLAFHAAGWQVVAARSKPDEAYTGIQAERLSALPGDTIAAIFDITDARAVTDAVQQHAPDLWIHHAGYATNHAGSDFDLAKGLHINAGSIPPLFKAVAGGSCGVIVTGTEAEYPAGDTPRREDMVGTPRSPYGLSKLAATMATEQYSEMTGVPARVARIFLPVGRLDNPGRLVPQVVASLGVGQSIELSSCHQQRDFTHVVDVAGAYIAIAEDFSRGGFDIFNVCSGEAVPLRMIVEKLAKLLEASADLLKFGACSNRAGEPERICGDGNKIRAAVGWRPRPLEMGLRADFTNAA